MNPTTAIRPAFLHIAPSPSPPRAESPAWCSYTAAAARLSASGLICGRNAATRLSPWTWPAAVPTASRCPTAALARIIASKFDAIAGGVRQAWSYHAVAAVIRAHSLLRSLPQVDPNRTGVTGISWGGYLTCIVAGLDDRFKAAVPVYGCGFIYQDKLWSDLMARLSLAEKGLWIENFDPSCYLPGCRTPILFVNGTNDFAYRMDCFQKSYRLVRGPRTLCVTINMKHSHPDGWAPKEIGIFVDSVLGGGKPLPRFERVSRHDRRIEARVKAAVPIREAALIYTTDSGDWKKRQWRSMPAQVEEGGSIIRAELPTDQSTAYFLNVIDERGATVSTEHEEIVADTVLQSLMMRISLRRRP